MSLTSAGPRPSPPIATLVAAIAAVVAITAAALAARATGQRRSG